MGRVCSKEDKGTRSKESCRQDSVDKTKEEIGHYIERKSISEVPQDSAAELSNSRYTDDACYIVRKEIVCSLQLFVARYYDKLSKDFHKLVNNTSGKRRVSIGTINSRMHSRAQSRPGSTHASHQKVVNVPV